MESNWDGPVTDEGVTLEQSLKTMIAEVVEELKLVHTSKYDEKRAIRTAALALQAQIQLVEFLSDTELRAKGAKNEVKIIEAEVYFENKESSDKKISEANLQQAIAKDKRVITAETKTINAEKEAKKWASILNILQNAHIFFRNLGKNEWNL